MAENSVPMQIWLGKQHLGRADKQAQNGPNGGRYSRPCNISLRAACVFHSKRHVCIDTATGYLIGALN